MGGNVVKVFALCLVSFVLTGCVLPPVATVASLLLDGASYASTGKSVSDHALSQIADADCALWYGFVEGDFCRDGLASDTVIGGRTFALHAGDGAGPESDDRAHMLIVGALGR